MLNRELYVLNMTWVKKDVGGESVWSVKVCGGVWKMVV